MLPFLKRFASLFSVGILFMGMSAFVPMSWAAASLSFNKAPVSTFNVTKTPSLDFEVKLSNFEKPVDVDFSIKPENFDPVPIQTLAYNGNTVNKYSWNGIFDGQKAKPGDYQAIFSSSGLAPLYFPFKVVTSEPTLAFSSAPSNQIQLSDKTYKVSVDLSGYASDTIVTAAVILSDANIYIPQAEYTYKQNGTHEFSWDISGYKPGTYSLQISGQDSKKNPTNILEHQFKVIDKQPTLTFNSTPSATAVKGEKNYVASVKLTSFTSDALVKAHIVDPQTAIAIPLDEYTFKSNDEVHEFTLDLSTYDSGNYQMQIYGKDKNNVETNVLTKTIAIAQQVGLDNGQEQGTLTPKFDPSDAVPVADRCAGYSDLKKTDWSCPAAEWAKAEGIMTGVEEGGRVYLDGYSYMNRAQQAKIALMAYKKYVANTNYCNDTKPFPDVRLNQWYSPYICLGKTLKMITGYLAGAEAGSYVPAQPVTIPEMFCLLVRPLNTGLPQGPSYPGLAADQWYSGCAKLVKDNNYFEASYIASTQPATRFNVLNFLYALHQAGKI